MCVLRERGGIICSIKEDLFFCFIPENALTMNEQYRPLSERRHFTSYTHILPHTEFIANARQELITFLVAVTGTD